MTLSAFVVRALAISWKARRDLDSKREIRA
jgi:hypothetical protein